MANTAAAAAQTQGGKIIPVARTITQEISTLGETVSLCVFLCVCAQKFVASTVKCVFEAGFCSNQASVKYLLEWMMILILVRYPQHVDPFWDCFSMVSSLSFFLPFSFSIWTGEYSGL